MENNNQVQEIVKWYHDLNEELERKHNLANAGKESPASQRRDRERELMKKCDDRDAPNIFPYKKCCQCSERNSTGNYDEDNHWFCGNCSCVCTQCERLVNCEREQIMLWNKGEDEEAICLQCHEDLEEEMRENGWLCDEDK